MRPMDDRSHLRRFAGVDFIIMIPICDSGDLPMATYTRGDEPCIAPSATSNPVSGAFAAAKCDVCRLIGHRTHPQRRIRRRTVNGSSANEKKFARQDSVSGIHRAKVHSARKPRCIKHNIVIPGFPLFLDERRHLLTERIENGQVNMPLPG